MKSFDYIKEQIELLDNTPKLMKNALNNENISMFFEFGLNGQRQSNYCEELLQQNEESLTSDEYDYLVKLHKEKVDMIEKVSNPMKLYS